VNIRRPTAIPVVIAAALAASSLGCGKKGPPLAPLRLVPAPVSGITARRTGASVQLRFVVPDKNQNGPGPIDLDRVEIYAATVGAGAPVPANRDLTARERLIGTVAVKLPPPEGEAAPAAGEGDTRPSPGERATFIEELTAEKLTPIKMPPTSQTAQTPPTPAQSTAPGLRPPASVTLPPIAGSGAPPAPAAAAQAAPDYSVRVYVIRAVSKAGRPGPPAERVTLPLVAVPSPPTAVAVKPSERAYVLDWVPPVADVGQPSLGFNVYLSGAETAPLNQAPVAGSTFEHGPIRAGDEQCFVVSSVRVVQNIPIESPASPPACTAWSDIYPPSAPRGLQAVAAEDGITLSWDGNAEPDVAGYLVLRGEGPGDTLQPLTREPIRETNYRDTAVQSGAHYVYAIVALDTATPPNTSQQSERQEVTAR
jgi:hypothetical protein